MYYGGYIEDALKEYTEAAVTLALIESSRPMPTADELGIGAAPYLGGLADTVGELRRFILDALRTDDFSRCEELLDVMDEIYTVLVTMDYPDAVTRGLRRSTDMVRGILETHARRPDCRAPAAPAGRAPRRGPGNVSTRSRFR